MTNRFGRFEALIQGSRYTPTQVSPSDVATQIQSFIAAQNELTVYTFKTELSTSSGEP
jgi:hypothetical protein